MNNTLKQLQEKGEEEFDYNFDFGIEDKAVKNFINQQTTLAFEAGKAEAIEQRDIQWWTALKYNVDEETFDRIRLALDALTAKE